MGKQGTIIRVAKRAANFPEKDVWAIFTPLAQKYNSVNLGQGFPNMPASDLIKAAACDAIQQNLNQYAPSRGLPALRTALSASYSKQQFPDRIINADEEILITQGANQAICLIMQTFLDPGDVAVLIEPFFDIYKPAVEIVGGRVRSVPMRFDGCGEEGGERRGNQRWEIDFAALKRVLAEEGSKARILLLNTPHNPTGTVLNEGELKKLAILAQESNLLVVSDEVYDRLCYNEERLPRIANQPEMWPRTLTVGSGGKSFGVTGWRVGWMMGSKELISACVAVQARTVFAVPTPLQAAVATAFESSERLFEEMKQGYRQKRDLLLALLEDCSGGLLKGVRPEGGYFIMADTRKLQEQLPECLGAVNTDARDDGKGEIGKNPKDYRIARWMTENLGVTPIPPSAFYDAENAHLGENFLRFCFAKDESTLREAGQRLEKLKTLKRYK